MKFIMTKIPVVENDLVADFKEYIKTIKFAEQYPNHAGLTISNDHPFEALLNGDGSANIFPCVTIVSTTDGEVPNMAKGWADTRLERGDLDAINPAEWYMADSSRDDLVEALVAKGAVYGVRHSTMWRDSTSFEVWSENLQVKNDLYNLILGYLTGPHVIRLHQNHSFVIQSDQIRGQRSGYYNFDFGRTLYGCKIDLRVDYPIIQAVYDTDITTLGELLHSYKEVLHG
jgi:hypothetical protein